MQHRLAAHGGRHRVGGVTIAHDQQRIGAGKLRGEWRTQGPAGKDARIADAAPRVDHGKGEILGQRAVLQAVVHHDHIAERGAERGAGDAIRRDDAGRGLRQKQRLVSDIPGCVPSRVDLDRTFQPAAIATGQEDRPSLAEQEKPRDLDGCR